MKRLVLGVFSSLFIASYAQPKLSYNLQRGIESLQNKNYDEAMEFFKKEIKDNPKNGYAYMLMASVHSDNHDNGLALSEADLALKYLPKNDKKSIGVVYENRAYVYTVLEDTAKALQDYAAALKANPQSSRAYEKRADIYYYQGKYALSDADYKKLISLDKGDVMGYMGIGRNFNAQKKWDEAIEKFNYVEKLDPTYSSAYSFRAESYIGKKDWNKSTDDLVSALGIDSDEKAFALMQELKDPAFGMLKSKFQVKAMKEPNESRWSFYNGVIHEHSDKYEKAIAYYEEANQRDNQAYYLERISKCNFEMGHYETSLKILDKALNMEPQRLSLIMQKAYTLAELGRIPDAIVQWDTIIARNPDYAAAYYSRARMKMRANDNEGAIEDLTMSITLDPEGNTASYSSRADLYSRLGKKDLANEDCKKIIEIEEKTKRYSRSQYAYLQLGELDKAIAVMDSIIAKDTADKHNYYNAACFYSKMNRSKEALENLEISFKKGFLKFEHLKDDTDLDSIRELPEFKALVKKYKESIKEDTTSEEKTGSKGTSDIAEIPFVKEKGSNLCNVKCTINELPLSFIFDTGASSVSLSQVEATFMMKNGYLSKDDIIGDSYYGDASGNINVGTIINLKKVNFGGLELTNVKASVVKNQKAPLLLGQSVLGRLGKIEIDNAKHVLRITKD